MEHKNIHIGHENICLCRCPCHFRNESNTNCAGAKSHQIMAADTAKALESTTEANEEPVNEAARISTDDAKCTRHNALDGIRNYRKSADIESKFAARPKNSARISSNEDFHLTAIESQLPGPYLPFRVQGPQPAEAVFSKCFLEVKNIVKNLRTKWESVSETARVEGSVKRHSLTGRCMDCASNINWKCVDKGDQSTHEWKHRDEIPKDIDEHTYSLVPLQCNRNLTLNDPHSPSANSENIPYQSLQDLNLDDISFHGPEILGEGNLTIHNARGKYKLYLSTSFLSKCQLMETWSSSNKTF